jgi:hypothetical protein
MRGGEGAIEWTAALELLMTVECRAKVMHVTEQKHRIASGEDWKKRLIR